MVSIQNEIEESSDLNLGNLIKPRITGGVSRLIAYERGDWDNFKTHINRDPLENDRGFKLQNEIKKQLKHASDLDKQLDSEDCLEHKIAPQLIENWELEREDAFYTNDSILPESFRKKLIQNDDLKFEFVEVPDTLILLSDTPRVDMRHLRELADKAGMMVFPYSLLKESALPIGETLDATEEMINATEDYAHYVLAPLSQLSLTKFAMLDDRPEVYASKDLKEDWSHISTYLVPSYRMIIRNEKSIELNRVNILQLAKRVDNLEVRVNDHSENLSQLEKNIVHELTILNNSINDIESKIAKERSERLQDNFKSDSRLRNLARTLQQEVARLDHRINCLQDPLFIAIPNDSESSTLSTSKTALLGPVWGPDLPQIVVAAMGLEETNARKLIQDNMDRWASTIRESQ